MSRAFRVASGISKQLITEASNGSLYSLSQIQRAVHSNPGSSSLDVAKVVFKHLDPAPLARFQSDSWDSEENRPHSDRAAKCLHILSDISVALHKDPVLRDFVEDGLAASLDGVCQWINHYFESIRPTLGNVLGVGVDVELFAYAKLLLALLKAGHPGWCVCWSSPAYAKLLARMWMTKNAKGRFAMAPTEDNGGCPIQKLVFLCMDAEPGRELFFEAVLMAHPDSAKRFTEATIARGKGCLYSFRIGVYLPCVLEFLHVLLIINLRGVLYTPLLQRALSKGRCLKELTADVVALAQDVGTGTGDNSALNLLHAMASTLLATVLSFAIENDSINRNLCDLIDGGYVNLLGILTATLPENDPAISTRGVEDRITENLIYLISSFSRYTIVPRVISRLLDSRSQLDGLLQGCHKLQ
ncbi:hypothetical protein D9611_000549 [Ephemerocybe angulata]|uniref:Uncharacterized protein n=1 Tax=Ephemerocybe angulata TaxID=980116 RepID=A0A8H5F6U6_9AGAR|nr:hypothetical protein D9611_000549 [Tulosesus angulatus]